MQSRDFNLEQLRRLRNLLTEQHQLYIRLWKRCQANNFPLTDPFVVCICHVSNELEAFILLLERLESQLPKPYRPLVSPFKTSGQQVREESWGEHQRRISAELEAERQKPTPPTSG